MRKYHAIGFLCAIAAMSGTAHAADSLNEPANDPFTWTGFYAGVNGGYAFGGDDRVGFTNLGLYLGDVGDLENSGFFGGAQIGYNYQMGNFVLGIEADFQGAGIDDELGRYKSKIDWFGTVRPRLGYAFDNRVMIYGTGGFAYGSVKYTTPTDFALGETETSKTRTGWVAGAGVEHAFTDHITAKVEYQYLYLGSETVGNYFITTKATSDLHTVRVGLNYKF